MSPPDAWNLDGVRLDLGIGWGQFQLFSDGPVRVQVGSDVFGSDFDPFTDFGNAVYGPGAFTVVRLDNGDSGEDFWWLGHDAGFSGPHGSNRENPGRLSVDPPAGGVALLTVYTNVPGYHLFVGGADESSLSIPWELGEHPALVASTPVPTVEGGADAGAARAAYRRHWLQELPALPPSAIYAYSWDSDFAQAGAGTGAARAGVASSSLDIGPLGQENGPIVGGPSFGFGGYFGGGSYRSHVTEETDDWQVSAWREHTDAGTSRTADGLAVLALPLQPPA